MRAVEIGVIFLYGLCLLFMLGFGLAQWQLTRRAGRVGPVAAPPPPAVWPRVTVQLPVYNELNVVERVIDAAAALDYPEPLLHVQVLDDSTDTDESVARAARVAFHRDRGLRIDHVRRATREGYKAGALAYGLTCTDGEFVAIFDADFVPEQNFLRQTLPHFTSPRVGMVQTRWGHLNENASLLTRLQAFGLNAHFLVEQVGRRGGGHFINFNGTGGVWRRSCIVDAGGHADTLTEDLDLSYRAQLRGWRFAYLPHVVAPAELPEQLDALKSQQFRWTKGAAETARKRRPGAAAGRWFVVEFVLLLAVSMGLALHNTRAVALGFLGRPSPFVRTPKLGLATNENRPVRRYRTRESGSVPLTEELMTLYFMVGLGRVSITGTTAWFPSICCWC